MITRTLRFTRVLLLVALAPAAFAEGAEVVAYNDAVRKVLKAHCVGCHGRSRPSAGLDLSSYGAILDGSSAGEVVIAGDPADSFLYLVTAHEEEPIMPPGGERIPEEDLLVLRQWIEQGMPEDSDSTPLPVASPEPPPQPKPSSGAPGVRRSPVIALAVSEPSGLIAIADQLRVLIYDLQSQELKGSLPFPEGEPQSLQFSWDGEYLTAGGGVHGESGVVVVWSVDPFECVWHYNEGLSDVALAADLSPNKSRVVLGGPERLIKLIDTATGTVISESEKSTDWVLDARFSGDGLLYATSDRDGGVYVWESSDGKLLHSLRGHTDAVNRLAWIDAEDRLATASEDGTVRLWDMHTGKQVKRWTAHETGVVDLALTTDGGFWSIGRDSQLKRWSKDGGEIEATACEEQPTALVSSAGIECVYGGQNGALLMRANQKETTLAPTRDHVPIQLASAKVTGAAMLSQVEPTRLTPEPEVAPQQADNRGTAISSTSPSAGSLRAVSVHEALSANADKQRGLSALQAKFDEAVALYEDDPTRPADLPRLFALTRASIAAEVSRVALERAELLRQRDEVAADKRSGQVTAISASPKRARTP